MELIIDPVAKPRMTRADKWKKRKCVVKYLQFKDELLEKTKDIDFGETLSLTFIIPMPKSWSKKKRKEMSGRPHKQRPDLDNLIKAFKDSVFKEDSHVWKYGEMKKIWGHKGAICLREL